MLTRAVIVFIAVVWPVAVVPDARAAIWQTRAQVDAAYGRPSRPCEDSPDRGFWYIITGRSDVLVTFIRGRSQREIFYRPRSEPITAAEVKALLQANSAGDTWRRYETDRKWLLGNPYKALAEYNAPPSPHPVPRSAPRSARRRFRS